MSQQEIVPMTSAELKKLFGNYAEDARFQTWSAGEAPGMQFVYACEFGTIWKFTPKAWWQFATRVVRNNGQHDFVLSQAMHSRPRHIIKGEDKQFYSSDLRMRCVNPLNWTLLDWTNELVPGRIATQRNNGASLRKPNVSATTLQSKSKTG